jgi:hypothetical protein
LTLGEVSGPKNKVIGISSDPVVFERSVISAKCLPLVQVPGSGSLTGLYGGFALEQPLASSAQLVTGYNFDPIRQQALRKTPLDQPLDLRSDSQVTRR